MKRIPVKTRAEPKAAMSWLCSPEGYESLCIQGYTKLSSSPEVQMAVGRIADLISSMTIHLMQNTDNGDVRIKNALSRKLDIAPNSTMTRKSLIYHIVRTMLLDGDGNAVVWPKTKDGLLDELIPLKPSGISFVEQGFGYQIRYGGEIWDPGDLLHFVVNPQADRPWMGQGYRTALKDVVQNLRQAAATQRGFMESKWQPSIIVRVDGMTEEFASKDGRKKLMEQYIDSSQAGEPWMIPADQFEIQQVKPLTLQDLAISDVVTLDKRTVAAILNVPPFVVGVGSYGKDEWNNFINTCILPVARGIEQELTRKLLYSPDFYFRFNPRSLYAYDMKELSQIGQELYVRGLMMGNEARDLIGFPPLPGLDERVILENYIPAGMIGDQKKLIQKGDEMDG